MDGRERREWESDKKGSILCELRHKTGWETDRSSNDCNEE